MQPTNTLRPPADGECQFCGARPAVFTTFESIASIVLIQIGKAHRGWMCRTCGLAMFRYHGNRSLVAGWWGVTVIALPIYLVKNYVRLQKVLKLPMPQPTPGVAAPNLRPL